MHIIDTFYRWYSCTENTVKMQLGLRKNLLASSVQLPLTKDYFSAK